MFYLGTITIPSGATGLVRSNWSTASGFTMPANIKKIMLSSDTDGVQFEFSASPSFQTTAARAAYLPDANGLAGPFIKPPTTDFYVVVYRGNQALVNVAVYAVH